jgi:hypothetical protein
VIRRREFIAGLGGAAGCHSRRARSRATALLASIAWPIRENSTSKLVFEVATTGQAIAAFCGICWGGCFALPLGKRCRCGPYRVCAKYRSILTASTGSGLIFRLACEAGLRHEDGAGENVIRGKLRPAGRDDDCCGCGRAAVMC